MAIKRRTQILSPILIVCFFMLLDLCAISQNIPTSVTVIDSSKCRNNSYPIVFYQGRYTSELCEVSKPKESIYKDEIFSYATGTRWDVKLEREIEDLKAPVTIGPMGRKQGTKPVIISFSLFKTPATNYFFNEFQFIDTFSILYERKNHVQIRDSLHTILDSVKASQFYKDNADSLDLYFGQVFNDKPFYKRHLYVMYNKSDITSEKYILWDNDFWIMSKIKIKGGSDPDMNNFLFILKIFNSSFFVSRTGDIGFIQP